MITDTKGITAKKESDFSEWYTQILQKGEVIEYSDVSGCYILRPRGYAIWEKIQEFLNAKIKSSGVKNSYFPLFIPESLLKKEADHFAGFTPEVAWVTKAGDTKLAEPLAVRPTSETIMYTAFSKWIRSYKDLPLKINQWCSVVRWEFKHPVPFLRSREFLWQEGHCAFSNNKECEEDTLKMLDFYAEVFENILAVPVIKGKKSEKEKFAGAYYTLTLETLLPNGKAIQAATSHNLGQNFARVFDIKFLDNNEKSEFVYQNSWGLSTRSIGIAIIIHSDDKGLIIPPNAAENKVVIVPIFKEQNKLEIIKIAKNIFSELEDFNPIFDDRGDYTPGWKFNEWELKGVPLRIEIGSKDVENKQVTFVTRHDSKKTPVKNNDLKLKVHEFLNKMQSELFSKAKENLLMHIKEAKDFREFNEFINNGNIVKIKWCNKTFCEEKIKTKFDGVKSLAIDFKEKPLDGEKCVYCSEKAEAVCYFGKSY